MLNGVQVSRDPLPTTRSEVPREGSRPSIESTSASPAHRTTYALPPRPGPGSSQAPSAARPTSTSLAARMGPPIPASEPREPLPRISSPQIEPLNMERKQSTEQEPLPERETRASSDPRKRPLDGKSYNTTNHCSPNESFRSRFCLSRGFPQRGQTSQD